MDSEVSSTTGTPKRRNEAALSKAPKISKFSGEGSGGSGGGGDGEASLGEPIQMMRQQHTNAIDKYTLKFGGTTWLGGGATGVAGEDNTWYRFPWESILDKVADWTGLEISQKWIYWKASKIHLQIKNPVCVQDIGSTTSGLATAGQNLHASLFGYVDDLYQLGVSNPFATMSNVDMTELIRSWRNHGYENGLPKLLQAITVGDGGGTFQNNYPDVKQCGMGNAHSLDFSWNIHSPFWRSTDELVARPTLSAIGGVHPQLMGRWDENMGFISTRTGVDSYVYWMGSINTPTLISSSRAQWDRYPNIESLAIPGRLQWPYADPNPIPGCYLQLQPQIGSITAGVSQSICQIHFEMEIEIHCRGRLPRMGADKQSFNNPPSVDNKLNGQPATLIRNVPIFVPAYVTETPII